MNHEKKTKCIRRASPTGKTVLKVVKGSTSKSVALKVSQLQIAVSITCHGAIRSIDHLTTNKEL